MNIAKVNNNSYNFVYFVDSCDLWNYHLGHINFCKLNDMMNLDLIPMTLNNINLTLLVC